MEARWSQAVPRHAMEGRHWSLPSFPPGSCPAVLTKKAESHTDFLAFDLASLVILFYLPIPLQLMKTRPPCSRILWMTTPKHSCVSTYNKS